MDKEQVIYICVCVCVCVYVCVCVSIHTHNGVLLSHKEEGNLFCNDMEGGREYYAKQNKSVRERQIPYDFIHMLNLRNKTNEQREEKERGKPGNRS